MERSHFRKSDPIRSPTPPLLDSSIEDIDELRMEQELESLDDIACSSKKPHFLDYDSIPPPGFEEEDDDDDNDSSKIKQILRNSYFPESKLDKCFETDGEISDFQLAANFKKINLVNPGAVAANDDTESCDSSSHFLPSAKSQSLTNTGVRRKKHFLDENPIPPTDGELDREREHHSLDRNFERTKDYDIKYERKHSLDRERSKKIKEPSYTLTRFLEHDTPIYRGTWPSDRPNDTQCSAVNFPTQQSSSPGELKNLGPKVECVYSLLSMLGCKNQLEMSTKFLELSKSPETCATLRHSRCIPLIVQMIHSEADEKTKKRASMALHNVVNCHPDDKAGRREAKVLRHIEQIMEYCDMLKGLLNQREAIADDSERHPLQAICSLMKISFDEEHRHAMCQLGALQAIANLVHYDHAVHGHESQDERCISLRRYAGMALTNLTFGDGNNKALLCTNREFMKALVAQLNSTADDLLQVTASVLRNLSWRADYNMKTVLNEIGTVTALSKAVMKNKNENTLKALLSALWNLSAHCSTNKAEFCAVDGALAFLCDMLVYEGPSKTLQIIENAGGILRNVSSHIAVREDYRKILRSRNCLGILLQQLSSESLTVVSNACGTLWNLSARCPEDQKFLLDNKAVSMLSLLIHSKHKMISNGSSAALKNLLNFRPGGVSHTSAGGTGDQIVKSMKLKELPSLNVRKQRALEHELDQNLSETCENIEVTTPAKEEKSMDDFMPHYEPANIRSRSLIEVKESRKITPPESIKTNPKPEPPADCQKTKDIPETSKDKLPGRRKNIPNSYSNTVSNSGTYQETDLDQITDFSLRYAENQNEESDAEETVTTERKQRRTTTTTIDEYGNEILLIVEDSVKCYQTEGTPCVISNAPSVSDLRNPKNVEAAANGKAKVPEKNSGCHTPEKPTKYCEEGTPGYFSRCDSFSSLDEEPNAGNAKLERISLPPPPPAPEPMEPITNPTTPGGGQQQKAVTFADYAQETPLMFSRHSSLDSLSSAEPVIGDDRSSIISDFSRLASGIISPSEIPDSPTQIVPNSPRRSSATVYTPNQQPPKPVTRLRSVFEDDLNTFGVENTPAQFSCATSLSNLSLDDEPKIASDSLTKEIALNINVEEEEEEKEPVEVPAEETAAAHAEEEHPSTNLSDTVLSDSEESDGDNLLFQNCINLGMNRGIKTAAQTPAATNNLTKKIDVLSDDSTSSSDAANDNLLEQCIRDGIQKTLATKPKSQETAGKNILPKTLVKENPLGMLRKGGIPSYMPSTDEMSKFNVEDSPCSYSILSGLSDISVGSGVARLIKPSRELSTIPQTAYAEAGQNDQSYRHQEDSLSSISLDSEDDTHILNQAIAAGSMSKIKSSLRPKTAINLGASVQSKQSANIQQQQYQGSTIHGHEGNESFSSIDSTDSNDPNHAYILEECIRSGMHKDSNSKSRLPLTERFTAASKIGSPVKSQATVATTIERRKDTDVGRFESQIKPPARHMRSVLAPTTITQDYSQRLASNLNIKDNLNVTISKNGETTSAAVLDIIVTATSAPSMVTAGVEKREHVDGTKELRKNPNATVMIQKIGSNLEDCILQRSFGSLNLSSDGTGGLDTSNEYPALRSSNIEITTDDSHQESSFEMEVSNEYLMEQTDEILSPKIDKHKDPDLMLKSVDRLTQELVSTAEYLRTTTTSQMDDDLTTVYENKSSSTSNTWNEDTCPNDVSFPSISMTAPMIASMNDDDATFSDSNMIRIEIRNLDEDVPVKNASDLSKTLTDSRIFRTNPDNVLQNASLESTLRFDYFSNSQPDSLDTDCNTIIEENTPRGNEIDFQVGGAVHSSVLSPTASAVFKTMTNSDIIAIEATKLVTELIDMQSMSESCTSLDLDNIRPPSGMDCISLSGVMDIPNSPQLSKRRKKSLPLGLMARRALSHAAPSGSLESVNSSCNLLENMKPPSIMDELLDSMISVSSITSEVLDYNTAHLNLTSHYETALSDADDTTTISIDLPFDCQQTPIPSDMSSAECTPKKVKSVRRTLTPRQKRHIVKDRYRTYTIAADIIVQEKLDELRNYNTDDSDTLCDDECPLPKPKQNGLVQDHCVNSGDQKSHDQISEQTIPNAGAQPERERRTIKQIRNDNKERYLTQVVKHFVPTPPSTPKIASQQQPQILLDDASDTLSILSNADSDASIRAISDKFKNIAMTNTQINGTAVEHLRQFADTDLSSIDFEQNSETESCDQNHYFDETTYTLASPPQKPKPKIVIPIAKIQRPDDAEKISGNSEENIPEIKGIRGRKKPAYVSPYRRTIATNPASVNRTTHLPVKGGSLETKKTVVSKLSPKTQTVVAKTHVLINKTTLTNKMKNVKTTAIAKVGLIGKRNIPEKNQKIKIEDKPATAPPILERQGTFVKDEPTNGDVPTVNSTAKSQPTSPAKSKLPSKLPTGKSMIPTSPSKSASSAAMQSKLKPPSPKIQSNSNGFIKTTAAAGSRPGTASSSTSSSSTDLSKRRTIGYFRSPSTPNVPQRSNSNTSLKSPLKRGDQQNQCLTQPPSRSNSNLMQSKRNSETTTTIGNRLSNLWKKDSPPTKASGKATGTPPTGKLIRSSTFDTTPIEKRVTTQTTTTAVNKTNQSNRQIETTAALKRPVSVSSVVHRVKNVTNTTAAATATKRLSRLNSFINVDE